MSQHPYLVSLCEEYVALVDAISRGTYSDFQKIDSQRLVTHEQLIQITGIDRNSGIDMYQYAKQVIYDHRMEAFDDDED